MAESRQPKRAGKGISYSESLPQLSNQITDSAIDEAIDKLAVKKKLAAKNKKKKDKSKKKKDKKKKDKKASDKKKAQSTKKGKKQEDPDELSQSCKLTDAERKILENEGKTQEKAGSRQEFNPKSTNFDDEIEKQMELMSGTVSQLKQSSGGSAKVVEPPKVSMPP